MTTSPIGHSQLKIYARRSFFPLLALAILAVLAAAVISLHRPANAQAEPDPVDVRVRAQLLADGRIEFGLRSGGEDYLPSSRFFLANATVDRWLQSSVIAVES